MIVCPAVDIVPDGEVERAVWNLERIAFRSGSLAAGGVGGRCQCDDDGSDERQSGSNSAAPGGPAVIQGGGNTYNALTGPSAESKNAAGFNVGKNATLVFTATQANGAILNIDNSGSPSEIFGQMVANDFKGFFPPSLYVANTNGIIVGADALIAVPQGIGLIGASMTGATAINDFVRNNSTLGSFINVTSATAILVPMGLSPYSGAKAGINFVTRIAAREFGTSHVRVNAIAPTFVPTAMNNYGGMTPIDDSRVDMSTGTFLSEAFANECAMKRVTTVDDCADVTVFLASDMSSSITGHIIPVDNGQCLMRLP